MCRTASWVEILGVGCIAGLEPDNPPHLQVVVVPADAKEGNTM